MNDYCESSYCFIFFFKQKTAYEMRISDWSSDVCSSDLQGGVGIGRYELRRPGMVLRQVLDDGGRFGDREAGSLLAQHRELRQRPHRRKGRARLRVAEV